MRLKVLNKSGSITLKDFSMKEYRAILLERNSYVLQKIRSYGVDYGGDHCSDKRVVSYDEIIPERILVKDGHFCGVCLYTDLDYVNGGHENRAEEVILLTDGSGTRSARSGIDFSNDDHSRGDYVDYYLVSRDEAEKANDRND